MSSDRASRRLAAIAALGAGAIAGAAALPAAAQDPPPQASTTAPAQPPAPQPDPAPPPPLAPPPAPVQPPASAPAEPPAPAPSPADDPAPPSRPWTPPVSGPLDFLNSPVSKLDLPPEPSHRPKPRRPPHAVDVPDKATSEREREEDEESTGGDGDRGGSELGDALEPGTRPAEIPSFFIDSFRIPPFLLPIYQAAGIQYGIPWEILAAINEIETDYGRNLNVSSAGALGWMQFMPGSWRAYGVDANEDGRKDPYNPVDAIFAAARYLRAAGAQTDLRRAIFAYNHADWYVDSVLERARLVAGLPSDLVGSLTGLAQGRSPVAGPASHAGRPAGSRPRRGLRILAPAGTPVVAVQDGEIVRVGHTPRLGRFVMLRDAYGNTYTYAHLAKVARSVLVARERAPARPPVAEPLQPPLPDPAPTEPATAGSDSERPSEPGIAADRRPAPGGTGKERLFANPARPRSLSAGGRRQILDATFALPPSASLRSYFAGDVRLSRDELELRRLYPGRRVIAGTILGRIGSTPIAGRPHVLFEIRPPGRDVPRIDPAPFVAGWRLLESTAIYRARGPAALRGGSIGQILLMSKDTLARRVLADRGVEIYPCGRRDIKAGAIDRRVLATLAVLSASGLRPAVSSLRCGHSERTNAGAVSHHASGNAVDIVKVNGTPIHGNQGEGTIADATVRRLLTLRGAFAPAQIISLMSYPGIRSTLAMSDHADHIHIGFAPRAGGRGVHALGLRPAQWRALVRRLGRIENPAVARRPSRYAIRAVPVTPSLRPPP